MKFDGEIKVSDDIRPYLNEIAERLWSIPGHAAVMIGSGFSKNAKSSKARNKSFPDWFQLGDIFYNKIHGEYPNNQKYLNPLKLADEVQAALGRPVLDQLILSSIPDDEFDPSTLHLQLLDLPWTDIFTTNYDTLLERARIGISEKNYQVVINKEDLIYSERPRIIKLHGSFPSERPFIITEEDYRKYPKEFAPFINTVQQSLLENTFCLLGFSGDDPNFLQWIGWIRDNLGKDNSPKLYLIGYFGLSDAQKKLLIQRNITVVDFSNSFEGKGSHHEAIELFFKYLNSRRTTKNYLNWDPEETSLSENIKKEAETSKLELIIQEWKNFRITYPGWIITPEDLRSKLLRSTMDFIHYVSNNNYENESVNLQFAFELNWRFEKCLMPIFDDVALDFENIILRHKAKHIENLQINVTGESEISKRIQLELALLRYYREEGKLEKWKILQSQLQGELEYYNEEQIEIFKYEVSLFYYFTLDLLNLKNHLENWIPNESLPFWESKRAGLLAELGSSQEAERILEKNLSFVRNRVNLKPVSSDYSNVSQEAYIMLLFKYIRDANKFSEYQLERNNEEEDSFSGRWEKLKRYKCDPWNELKLFERTLRNPKVELKEVEEIKEFDLGRITISRKFGGDDRDLRIAYSYLRFLEETGLPLRIGNSTFGKDSANGTLKRLFKFAPFWTLAILIRIGDKNSVNIIFNRESISRMPTKDVNALVLQYLKAANDSNLINQTDFEGFANYFKSNLYALLPEILSRLCVKTSFEIKVKLLNYLLEIYNSPVRKKFMNVDKFTDRLINSFSKIEQMNLLEILLKFPNLGNDTHFLKFENPLSYVDSEKKLPIEINRPKLNAELVDSLFKSVRLLKGGERSWIICTLLFLEKNDLLSKGLREELGRILWENTDSTGFPVDINYHKFAFLFLPHPEEINVEKLFKEYIKNSSFPIQGKSADKDGISIGTKEISLCIDLVGARNQINWTKDEIIELSSRLFEWWDFDKIYLEKYSKRKEDERYKEFNFRFSKMLDVFVFVIAPNLDFDYDVQLKGKIILLIEELKKLSIPTLRLEAAFVKNKITELESVLIGIENQVISSNYEYVADALNSIYRLLDINIENSENKFISKLIDLEVQMVLWRKSIGLSGSMNSIGLIIEKYPDYVNETHLNKILLGLENLIHETNVFNNREIYNDYQKLEIRQDAARLSFKLFNLYSDRGQEIPSTLNSWKSICQSEEEFSEIKLQWQ
ncbi:anti-phage defense-associated sirtuin Dsr2 [Leptospira santarosai]|uniref:anti-phage defense-associated sirtuin Dsr2 n=1 Tax=Leptospira santarosai TaxID=28183 RepID=UPI0026E1C77A|nr:anti-phage defense-associated sirtuin Dsr2 [Leptospira santarosai]MDO6384150.1 anti-phage defense-associated sirtuin Dsr2 [Leptospira santarosai]